MMKRNSFNKVLSAFLCIFLVLSMMSSAALAASKNSGKCGKNVKWSYNKKNRTLTISGKEKMKNYKVTSEDYDWGFDTNAPWNHKSGYINKIVIKKGVTYIGELAFGCSGAKKVSIPKTVKRIGSCAFYGCDLRNVTIPEGVTTIDDYAFILNWEMRSIKIPKSVKKIGKEAFGIDVQGDEPYEGFVIYGYKGTVAEKYAKKHNITFKRLK